MFAFNDAWLINESLAFHVSTSTFNNPAFDQEHIDSANGYVGLDGTGVDNYPSESTSSRLEQDKKSGQNKESCRKAASQSLKSSFADNLAFSIRSKLFVIDLNFKRKLRSLRAFAIRHFPGIFELANNHYRRAQEQCYRDNKTDRFVGADYLQGSEEHFWKNFVEPSSRKSLGKQKEKILNRLERVLEQKRSRQDHYYRQKKKHLVVSDGTSTDGGADIHYRPGIRPSQSFSVDSQSSSLSSLATATGFQYSSSPLVREQTIIIESQQWAKRQQACQSSGKVRYGSKWKQIRDMVFDDSGVEAPNSKKLCIVCYTNTPNIVTIPCQHHDVCSDCFIEMIYIAVKKSQYPLKCALCRQKVEKIRCSRKLLLSVIEKQRIYP